MRKLLAFLIFAALGTAGCSAGANGTGTVSPEKAAAVAVMAADSVKPQSQAVPTIAPAATAAGSPGSKPSPSVAPEAAAKNASPVPTPTPSATADKHKAGVEIVSVTSPAARNGTAKLKAKVTPGATASITVHYKSGPSTAAGLDDKQADSEGNVSWSWKVGGNTTLGVWPITVSCEGSTAKTSFEVVR